MADSARPAGDYAYQIIKTKKGIKIIFCFPNGFKILYRFYKDKITVTW
jgi:hypothetical protein